MTDSTRTGAELFVDALADYGVTRVFGNPGTTEVPLLQAIGDREMEYVLGLHEDVAVGMAAGYATRRRYHAHRDADVTPLGVVNLHLAPGLAHGLGNLDGADWAGAPLLVTAGQHSTDFAHEEPILSGDTARMAEQHTKWSAEVQDVEALPTMLRRAVTRALTPPTGPVFLALPVDVQLAETTASPERLGSVPDAGRGSPRDVAAAADVVADADDVVLVAGQGVPHSPNDGVDAAVELAEAGGAAVYGEALTAEMPFPAAHDQWLGTTPTTTAGYAAVHDADVVVFLGVSRTHTTSIRHEGDLIGEDTTCVYLGDDADELGKNYPADVAVLGDPGLVAGDLADAVREDVDDTERSRRLDRVADRAGDDATSEDLGDDEREHDSGLLSKTALIRALHDVAPDARLVNEGVTASRALFEAFPMAPEQLTGLKSGGLGYGLPSTVGAAVAEEEAGGDDPVVGLVGDGSYLYYPQALYSAARYGVDLTVVVPDNRNYRILKDNTMRLLGGEEADHEFVGMDFEPAVDFVGSATAHGATGERVEDPDEIRDALERALAHDGPYVVDALVHD